MNDCRRNKREYRFYLCGGVADGATRHESSIFRGRLRERRYPTGAWTIKCRALCAYCWKLVYEGNAIVKMSVTLP